MTETMPGLNVLVVGPLCFPHAIHPKPLLNLLQDALLELPLNLLSLLIGPRLAVQSHQSTEVELGCLEELDLADVDLIRDQLKFPIDGGDDFGLTFWRG